MSPLEVVTLGETMVAFEAMSEGPLRDVTYYKKWIGGAELNLSIGLARLGIGCGWISRVGGDEFGKEIVRQARGEGVDVSRVITDKSASTGVFFVERYAGHESRCYYYRKQSAAAGLVPEDLDAKYIGQAKVVCLTGITPALGSSARQTARAMIQMAAGNKQILVFDPNLRLTLWNLETAREVLIPMMRMSTYVLAGDEELMHLVGGKDLSEAVEHANAAGIGNLVVKLGARGAMLTRGGQLGDIVSPFVVGHPVSSMGAGDSFAAGFVAGLLKGQAIEECVRWGNAMGAFCVTAREPYYALPGFEELENFLQRQAPVLR